MARGNGIEIAIAADTGAFEKGIKSGIIDSTGKAEEALEKLGKTKGPERLERELKEAQEATEKLGDETKRTSREIEENFRRAYKKIKSDSTDELDRVGETTREVSDEAKANLSEVASSFSGDMTSAVDLVQGTLGGLASMGGPLGLVFAAAAAGVGLLINNLIESEEKAEELRLKAVEIANEAVTSGTDVEAFVTAADRVVERIQELEELKSTDWRWFWEEDPSQLDEWQKGLKALGREADEVEFVLSGSTDTLDGYTKGVQDARDAVQEQYDALANLGREATYAQREEKKRLSQQLESYDDVLKYLDEEITLRDQATSAADRQYQAGIDAAMDAAKAEEAAAEAAQHTADVRQSVADSVIDAYDSMRGAATSFATNEEGSLDINRWLEYVNEHAGAVATYQSNIQAMKLSPEQWANLLEMPEDQRMQWVEQFTALPEDARAPFAAALNDVGSSGGSEAAVAFDDAFNPKADVQITTKIDTTEEEAALEKLVRERTATIVAKLKDEASKALDEIVNKERTAVIKVVPETWQYDNWVPPKKYATVVVTKEEKTWQ